MINKLLVSFHGTDLTVIEYNSEPYVPMKPIVEGMGLSWGTQSRKLRANPQRWGMFNTNIPSIDLNNEVSCIPLRKVFGWLSNISPNKVRPEIRDKVIQYQNECDDVLWHHWNQNQPSQSLLPSENNIQLYSTRVMLTIENSHVVHTSQVPDDAFVVTKNRLCSLLNEPGLFSIEEMAQVAQTAQSRIVELATALPKLN